MQCHRSELTICHASSHSLGQSEGHLSEIFIFPNLTRTKVVTPKLMRKEHEYRIEIELEPATPHLALKTLYTNLQGSAKEKVPNTVGNISIHR